MNSDCSKEIKQYNENLMPLIDLLRDLLLKGKVPKFQKNKFTCQIL